MKHKKNIYIPFIYIYRYMYFFWISIVVLPPFLLELEMRWWVFANKYHSCDVTPRGALQFGAGCTSRGFACETCGGGS